jgi:hypothetical protein
MEVFRERDRSPKRAGVGRSLASGARNDGMPFPVSGAEREILRRAG